jgi:type IV secretion system protein VirD4
MPENTTAKVVVNCLIGLAALVAWEIVASLVFCFKTHLALSNTAWLTYAHFYWGDPRVMPALELAAAIPGVLLAVAGLFALVQFKNKLRPLHGEAAWEDDKNLKKNDLRDQEHPIYLGRSKGGLFKQGELIGFGTPEHVIVYARPRTGKTSGLAIPNAQAFRGSVFGIDIRKDIWKAAAGIRAQFGQKCFLFDPLNSEGRTSRYNPLGYVRDGIDAFTDMQHIGSILIPHISGDQAFWSDKARMGFVGVGLMLKETDGAVPTVGEIVRILTGENPAQTLRRMMEAGPGKKKRFTANAVSSVQDFLNIPPGTYDSIRSTITQFLAPWFNPRVDAATTPGDAGDVGDFDLRRLKHELHFIMVGMDPDDLSILRPVVRLMIEHFIGLNIKVASAGDPAAKNQILFIGDEFTQLGRMNHFAQSFSYIGGYGIRALLITQSKQMLKTTYTPDMAEAILQNCGAEVVYGTNDPQLARELSERMGSNTEEHVSVSTGGGRRNTTRSKQRRPLMLPQEIAKLHPDELIVMRPGLDPVLGRKIRWWKELPFSTFRRPPPVVPGREIVVRYADSKKDRGGPPAPPSPPQARGPKPAEPAAKPKQPSFFDAKSSGQLLEDIGGQPDVDLSKFKGDPQGAANHLKKVIEKARAAGREKPGKAA